MKFWRYEVSALLGRLFLMSIIRDMNVFFEYLNGKIITILNEFVDCKKWVESWKDNLFLIQLFREKSSKDQHFIQFHEQDL